MPIVPRSTGAPPRRGLALGLALCLGLSGLGLSGRWIGRAHAAEGPRPKLTEAQKQEVRDRYDRATRFYYLRKYNEAIAQYETIYLLSADPVMLYNIAQCHRQADQPEQAVEFYKNYLRNAPAATNRTDVEKKIAEMEKVVDERRKIANPTASPTSPPPASAAPLPPPIAPTSPPPSTTTAPPIATGRPPAVKEPPPIPTSMPTEPMNPPGEATIAAPAPSAEATPTANRMLPLSLLVGGGVFVATSVVLGLVAASKASTVEKAARERPSRIFDRDLEKTEDAGRTANGLAIGTGLIGMAAVGAGVYFLFVAQKADEAAREATVLPALGPGYAGATAQVRF